MSVFLAPQKLIESDDNRPLNWVFKGKFLMVDSKESIENCYLLIEWVILC